MKNCVICGKTANGLVWIECELKDGVGGAFILHAVVDLVGDHRDAQLGDLPHAGRRKQVAGGVGRRINENAPGGRRQPPAQVGGIVLKAVPGSNVDQVGNAVTAFGNFKRTIGKTAGVEGEGVQQLLD